MSDEYIIKNCPCLFNSYYASGKTVRFECNDGNHDDKLCRDVADCLLKRIYEDVKTVYRTPEYFEELAKRGDKEQELIESAWHNVALMVIGKLDIQECDNE